MIVKQIVCLANSRKISGRCVAGKILDAEGNLGKWLRPISSRPTQEVSEEERSYSDGSDPRLLDVIDIPLLEAQPHAHQAENYLIDHRYYWVKKGQATWDMVKAAIDHPPSLWGVNHGNGSSYYGFNDRIPRSTAEGLDSSLVLVEPSNFCIRVATEGEEFDNPKRRVRADFSYRGEHYRFSVTDPSIARRYLAGEDGERPLDDVIICVSLGESYSDGYCYKFCAAVISH